MRAHAGGSAGGSPAGHALLTAAQQACLRQQGLDGGLIALAGVGGARVVLGGAHLRVLVLLQRHGLGLLLGGLLARQLTEQLAQQHVCGGEAGQGEGRR